MEAEPDQPMSEIDLFGWVECHNFLGRLLVSGNRPELDCQVYVVKQGRILVQKWAEGLANSIKASGVFKRNECKYSADLYKSGKKQKSHTLQ